MKFSSKRILAKMDVFTLLLVTTANIWLVAFPKSTTIPLSSTRWILKFFIFINTKGKRFWYDYISSYSYYVLSVIFGNLSVIGTKMRKVWLISYLNSILRCYKFFLFAKIRARLKYKNSRFVAGLNSKKCNTEEIILLSIEEIIPSIIINIFVVYMLRPCLMIIFKKTS